MLAENGLGVPGWAQGIPQTDGSPDTPITDSAVLVLPPDPEPPAKKEA